MIGFQHPWLLLGAMAALWPLWLHLRGRNRAHTLKFSAIQFLHRQHPQRARAQRLRERALLLARVLLASGVAIALAGPLVPGCDESDTPLADRPLALVLVLDDSLSMSARTDGLGVRFERARSRALTLLERLPRGSRAMVVTSALPARALRPRLDADIDSLRGDVQSLQPRQSGDDALSALQLAARLLAHTDEDDRRVVILSDLQAPGWNSWPQQALAGLRVEVETIAGEVENTAILSAEATPAPERGAHQWRLVVELAHEGRRPFVGPLVVRVGPQEVRRQVEVAAGARRRFELPLQAADAFVEVALPGGDGLDRDDERLCALGGGAALRVALLNGAPRPVAREDEVHFLHQALLSASGGGTEIEVTLVQPSELDATRLQAFDVVWAANVGELPKPSVDALRARLEVGMGLVVSAGDESAPAAGTGWLQSLLPDLLGPAQDGPALPGIRHEEGPPTAELDPAARALRRALAGVEVGLRDLQVHRRLTALPSVDLESKVALRHDDGAPALLAKTVGRGRVLVWTSSIDLDWSDLPLQPGMLPLVTALVQHAPAGVGTRPRGELEPGQTFELARAPNATALEIADAGGAVVVTLARDVRRSRWRINGLPSPGLYRVRERDDGGAMTPLPDLFVVPPVAESRLADVVKPPRVGRSGAAAAVVAAARQPRVPVAPIALGVLLMLLIFEAWLLAGDRRMARPANA